MVASGDVGRRKSCVEEKVEERMVIRTWKTNLFVFGVGGVVGRVPGCRKRKLEERKLG